MRKSKKIYYKNKHVKSKKHVKKHVKKTKTRRRRLYRKRREIQFAPGIKSTPIFSLPEKKNNTPILDSLESHNDVSLVPGLRNYLKK